MNGYQWRGPTAVPIEPIHIAAYVEQLAAIYKPPTVKKHPDAAKVDERSLTLKDIESLGSPEFARDHLVDRRIDDIIRGNVGEWIDFLKGMDLRSLTAAIPSQRR